MTSLCANVYYFRGSIAAVMTSLDFHVGFADFTLRSLAQYNSSYLCANKKIED